MKYIQLKNKILKLENCVNFLIANNRYKNLSAQIKYSNDWLDCYMDLQALRGKFELDEDKDPLYAKLRQIRKELSYIRG
ncbi:MAG: hypothetical protein UHK60_09070 [Acutalibacteraceae bacterium]|nr:hypothetical protein [Acutalibacteraceae bacterium]